MTTEETAPKKQRTGLLKSVGPAIIVAAVVLGPGSILTSSKVGATFGVIGFPVVLGAAVLMIGMVALSARIGVIYDKSPCEEISDRIGRPVSVLIGLALFLIVALFQSSNNIALVGGIEPLFATEPAAPTAETTAKVVEPDVLSVPVRAGILIGANLLVIASLYLLRNLYKSIEGIMKILMGMMIAAFLVNFLVVIAQPRTYEPVASQGELNWIPLLGMIGTTFSVAGAFYQAYLVKEKGWGLTEAREGVVDSIVSISMLGGVTAIILLTSWRVFYGNPNAVELQSVGQVAMQLEPSFGVTAKYIFCSGILAGAVSSFMVNALIGGTVLSDSVGKGSKLDNLWPLHFTTLALLVGMSVAIASFMSEDSIVALITLAQALTVLGNPALALALIYLATRRELIGPRKVPGWILGLAILGFLVSCWFAYQTAQKVYDKLNPPPETTALVICDQCRS